MKLFKPLKYVITAAAVCILCFSGNGEYIYAVFAVSPENDIVEQPQQNGFSAGKPVCRNSESAVFKRYLKKYTVTPCSTLNHKVFCCYSFCDAFSPDLACGRQRMSVSESKTLCELFTAELPGNRSP